MDLLASLLGEYYGIDWATLFLGVTASFLVTGGHLRVGFTFGIIACAGGFIVALMSGQNGFVVYNLILMALNVRGILRNRRAVAASVMPQGAPASAPAQ